MERQRDRQATRDAEERANERCEPTRVVDIARPMQGRDRESALKAMPGRPLRRRDVVAQHFERIDHDVADKLDAVRRNVLAQQVGIAVRRWRPQKVGARPSKLSRRPHSSNPPTPARSDHHTC